MGSIQVPVQLVGSSPRLRGTSAWCGCRRVVRGIIPALAGNIFYVLFVIGAHWDHPRACGEHGCHPVFADGRQGSSPRLRGTYTRPEPRSSSIGIIPALAGNIRSRRVSVTVLRDHPRACGEHPDDCPNSWFALGSSPRLRGTFRFHRLVGEHDGIIPALAGNMYFEEARRINKRDHPRACGEHCVWLVVCWLGGGIIPALAGNIVWPT